MLQTFPKEEYQREYNILKAILPLGVYEILQALNVKVAGGTLTSLFSNREVNDIDLYFPSWENMETFIAYMYDYRLRKGELDLQPDTDGWGDVKRGYYYLNGLSSGEPFAIGHKKPENKLPQSLIERLRVKMTMMNEHSSDIPWGIGEDIECERKITPIKNIGMTDKSIMFSGADSNPVMQCICFDTFATTQDIFDKFDFTINMGAFNFAEEVWEFDKRFMKHIAQKVLVLNPNTDYPIISMLRSDKYRARGYTISRRETMKLGLACSGLKIETWEDAKAHLSGMYGTNVEQLFNETKPFSFELLFDKLDSAGDRMIASIATESEKKDHSQFNLKSVSFFPALQRLRKHTGRPHFTKMWGVVSTERLYMMQAHTRSHKIGILQDTVAEEFCKYVDLYIDEPEAISSFQGSDKNTLVEVSISDTSNIDYFNAEIQIMDKKETTLRVERIIESKGELS